MLTDGEIMEQIARAVLKGWIDGRDLGGLFNFQCAGLIIEFTQRGDDPLGLALGGCCHNGVANFLIGLRNNCSLTSKFG